MTERTVADSPASLRKGPPVNQEAREAYVGKYGRLSTGGMLFNVKIKDIRNRYGNLDVLVTPMSGSGEKWVQVHRIQGVLE
jgi:hypothetical protein